MLPSPVGKVNCARNQGPPPPPSVPTLYTFLLLGNTTCTTGMNEAGIVAVPHRPHFALHLTSGSRLLVTAAGYLSSKNCATHENLADIWNATDITNRQRFRVLPAQANNAVVANVLQISVKLTDSGRTAGCTVSHLSAASTASCGATSVVLTHTAEQDWVIVPVAGEPGVVYIRSMARPGCAEQYLGVSTSASYCTTVRPTLAMLYRPRDPGAFIKWKMEPTVLV